MACTARRTRPDRPDGWQRGFRDQTRLIVFPRKHSRKHRFRFRRNRLIGQYAHGNEPSHHVAYLYSYAGHPEKTQQVIREVFDRFYLAQPDGLCGNDDCGQMSAWYIFSAMGFYPVNPISGEYVLGAPQIEKISLSLPEGKTFTVEAKGLSKTNKYVKSVELNGKPVTGLTISHKDVMNGGNLVFTMTDQPGR